MEFKNEDTRGVDLLADTTENVNNSGNLHRDHHSIDDFEHLDSHVKDFDVKTDELFDKLVNQGPTLEPALAPTPVGPKISPALATQGFLDTEREEMVVSPSKISQHHMADKFTDSESDTSESPRRAAPPPPLVPLVTDEPPALPARSTPAYTPSSELISTAKDFVDDIVNIAKPEAPLPPMTTVRAPTPPAPVVTAPAPVLAPAPVDLPKPSAPAAPVVPKSSPAPPARVLEAEVIFCQMGLDAWFNPERLHPKVESLIYWRDPQKSGVALGAGLVLLLSLAWCSLISVLAYSSLLVLTGTIAFRIYKNVLQAVQKTSEGHPFKPLLEKEIALPAERAQSLATSAVAHANAAVHELRRLFLVEDLVDSLKFGVSLWCLTYVGAWVNGITLVIIGYVALFTLPKAYEANKAQVDANLEQARAKIHEITTKVRAAVPIGKKLESEKDK